MADETARPGLRERKNSRTRAAIVRAAAELTLEESFAAATIGRIAERADVSPRTVSTWFPVKEDILFGATPDLVERIERVLLGPEGSAVDRLRAWMTEEGRAGGRDGDDLRLLQLRAIVSDPDLRAREAQLFAPLRRTLAAAAARDLDVPASHLGPQVFATAALGVLYDLREKVIADDAGPEPYDVELAMTFLRAGLAAMGAAGGP